MILAFDTYYFNNSAKTVCLAFENWTDSEPRLVKSEILNGIAEYIPGEFYRRELPCILSLLNKLNPENAATIIIDGFVVLDDSGKLGLGGHLYEQLNRQIPVIGVAKTNFLANTKCKQELFRGTSKRPLYITSMGITISKAAEHIRQMHGEHRIPVLLKILDTQTRDINCG